MPPRSFVISLLCLPARINERGSVRGVAFLIALSAGVVHAEGDGGASFNTHVRSKIEPRRSR
jgi:hypothetical protein